MQGEAYIQSVSDENHSSSSVVFTWGTRIPEGYAKTSYGTA
jgi:hypothetical protein